MDPILKISRLKKTEEKKSATKADSWTLTHPKNPSDEYKTNHDSTRQEKGQIKSRAQENEKKRRNHDSTRQKNRKKIVGNKNVKACTSTVVCGLESWESSAGVGGSGTE